MNSYNLVVLGVWYGSMTVRRNLPYYTRTERWAVNTYKATPDIPRALLLKSYDKKTPWFRVVQIKTLGV